MTTTSDKPSGNGRKPNGGAQADSEQRKGATEFAPGTVADEFPVDDDDDRRSQLSKLALSLMGCQPELSMAKEQVVTIDGQPQKIKAGTEIHQATIFGYINDLTGPKELPNAKSERDKITYGLKGMIEGVNVRTGEMFKAAILYLPAGFHDMFLSEMEAALKAGDTNTQIAFALEFWSIPSDNPRGYAWKAKNKLPMEKKDPLAGLRSRALKGTTIKALSAPKERPIEPVTIEGQATLV